MEIQVKEFSQLPQTEQVKYVQNTGRYLHARLKGWCHISLYFMGTFYAEVWLLEHCGSVGMIRTFTSQEQLEPYLKTTSMDTLVQELLHENN